MTSFFSGQISSAEKSASKFFSSDPSTNASTRPDDLPDPLIARRTRVIVNVGSSTKYVEFDASMNEVHDGKATATKHTVEDRLSVTDNIQREPESLTMRAIVSNDVVLGQNQTARPAVSDGVGTTRNDRASAFSGGFNGNEGGRAEEAYAFLREVKNKGQLVAIYTTLHYYTDMYISSVSCTRDATSGNMVDLNLTFNEIQIAATQTVDAPVPKKPARAKNKNLGKKPLETPTAPKQSAARQLIAKFTGVGG